MKLTFLFSFFVIASSWANTYSQTTRVNLNLRNVLVQDFIQEIEEQTDFYFLYQDEIFRKGQRVTIDVNNETLDDVIRAFEDQTSVQAQITKYQIILKKKQQASLLPIEQQEKQVMGVVTDKDGIPIPGVTVLLKGTTTGTTTDVDGKFSFKIPVSGKALQFSFVGMKTEVIEIGSETTFNVELVSSAVDLEEIIAVGYGTQKKREVTGSVAQIRTDKLTKAPVSTFTNTLTGRLPGLMINQRSAEPGKESMEVLVRGKSTFGNNSALIVIDGIAGRDGLSRLDPNEIETVSVLKDASAAIYGARAANGVILITTKKGAKGKAKIRYSYNMGWSSPVRRAKQANGYEYAQLVNLSQYAGSGWDDTVVPEYNEQELEDLRIGITPSYDWFDLSYKDQFSQTTHNISASGGNDNVNYFVSGRIFEQGTLFRNDPHGGNEQYNLRSNLNFKFSDDLDVSVNLSGRQQEVTYAADRGAIFSAALLTPPTQEPYVNGDERYVSPGRAQKNPISVASSSGYDRTENFYVSGTLRANYKLPFVKGLTLSGVTAFDFNRQFRKNWHTQRTYYSANPDGDPIPHNFGSDNLQEWFGRSRSITYIGSANYVKSISDHNFNLLAQVEKNERIYDNFTGKIYKFATDAIEEFNGGSRDRGDSALGGGASESSRLSYSGRLNYNYKSRYLLQFIFRYDGSMKFADDDRFGFFPGISAGWVVSEENWLQQYDWLQNWKIRASWGILGNDAIPDWQYLSRYKYGRTTIVDGNVQTGIEEDGVSNPGITWEETETFNLGTNIDLFQNKINVELDLFKANTSQILANPNLTLPQYTGIKPPKQNLGKYENKGYELSINYRGQIRKLKFEIGGNISQTKNKLVYFDEPPYEFEYQAQTGHPYSTQLRYHAIGIFRTEEDLQKYPKIDDNTRLGDVIIYDANNDGKINHYDKMRLDKNLTPEVTYGFHLNTTYKNLSLSTLWQGAAGGVRQVYNTFGKTYNTPGYWLYNTWTPENPDARFPRLGTGNDTDIHFLKTNYIRLKNIELAYDVPVRLIKRSGVKGLRCFLTGYNLFTWDKLEDKGANDPEQSNDRGWDFPNLKTVSFGVNVTL